MVGTSNFRDKFRSKALKQLAKERAVKKDPVAVEDKDSDSDDSLELGRSIKKSRNRGDSLLSILPEPTNSKSSPAFDLLAELITEQKSYQKEHLQDKDHQEAHEVRDMMEIDVSKLINDNGKELYVADTRTDTIKMPKSKEKEKNQITHLAKLAKAAEFVIQERASQGRANRAAARSKYGW